MPCTSRIILFTGDVPYIICLDRESRSIVLSIRGTQSLADAATDLLAYPHPLHHWLPHCNKQVSFASPHRALHCLLCCCNTDSSIMFSWCLCSIHVVGSSPLTMHIRLAMRDHTSLAVLFDQNVLKQVVLYQPALRSGQ